MSKTIHTHFSSLYLIISIFISEYLCRGISMMSVPFGIEIITLELKENDLIP